MEILLKLKCLHKKCILPEKRYLEEERDEFKIKTVVDFNTT